MDPARAESGDDTVVEALIVECIARIERDGRAAVPAFLAAHPEQAEALRRQLDRLEKLGLLLSGERESPLGGREPESDPQVRVAGYQLLHPIGGGGMGMVYVAREESLGRDVALKVIRPELLLFPGARDRFRREVETIARLDHPGIVPVYAFGEDRGVPWFSMPRVRGVTLDAAFRALAGRDAATLRGADLRAAIVAAMGRDDGAGGGPIESADSAPAAPAAPVAPGAAADELPPIFAGTFEEACLRIVRQVADALQHAHAANVIHRDVKPSNVMVTPTGRAMLLDFGLAWSESAPRVTGSGSHMGSLHYMAPEVLRSDSRAAAPRSDVYALGVTLFEMLTLRHAFEGTADEIRTRILEGVNASPRKWNRALTRDAAVVCGAAMDVEPARRYARAADFGRDIDNVLDGRPVEARPASAWYLAWRWTTNHPSAAAAIVLLGVLVIGGPWVYAVQADRARQRVEEKQVRVEAWFDRATRAVDTLLTRVGDESLRDVPQVEPVRRQILEDALEFYRDFLATEEGADPDVAIEAARVRTKAAAICKQVGDLTAAESYARTAFESLRGLVASARDTDAARHALGTAGLTLGEMLYVLERNRDALEVIESTIAEVAKAADTPARVRLFAQLDSMAGRACTADPSAQVKYLGSAMERAESLLAAGGDAPSAADVRLAVDIAGYLAHASHRTRSFADEESWRRRAVDLTSELAARSPGDRAIARLESTVRTNLAGALSQRGAVAEAEEIYRESISFWQAEVADFPSVPEYRRTVSMFRQNLALELRKQKRCSEALEIVRPAVADMEWLVERYPGDWNHKLILSLTLYELAANLEVSAGSREESRTVLRRAVELLEDIVRKQPDVPGLRTQLADYLGFLGYLEDELGDSDEAVAIWTRSAGLYREVLARHPDDEGAIDHLFSHYRNLSERYWLRHEYAPAAEAAEAIAEVFPEGHVNHADAHARAAECIAKCAPLALEDATLDEAKREEIAAGYDRRALELLRVAIHHGFKKIESVRRKPEFERVRRLADFDAVMAERIQD